MVSLIRSLQSLVDSPHHAGHAVGRIQALVRIHFSAEVGIGRHLPAADVNCLQTGVHLLDGLVAGHRAQSCNVGLGAQQIPKIFSAHLRKGVLDADRPA